MDIFTKGLALFLAVLGAYFYARHMDLGLGRTQTFAFSAWIFGHIFLAFVSRSGTEPVFSIGIFTNPVINVWAAGAIAFLFLAVFFPFLGERFNLAPIGLHNILAIAAATLIIIGAVEAKKYFGHPEGPHDS
jgi:Ca2+-transporting ATPase